MRQIARFAKPKKFCRVYRNFELGRRLSSRDKPVHGKSSSSVALFHRNFVVRWQAKRDTALEGMKTFFTFESAVAAMLCRRTTKGRRIAEFFNLAQCRRFNGD